MATLTSTLGLVLGGVLATVLVAAPRTFKNPLSHGADPCLVFYKGYYYLSVTTGRDVKIKRAKRLGDLAEATAVTVYHDTDPTRNRDVWAPEFHQFEGKWYLYVTGGNGAEPSHRIIVAESESDTPMGPYYFKAKLLTDPKDEFYAIDFHPYRLPDGRLYGVWCGRPSSTGQGLYISKMANPWTLEGPRQYLDVSGFGCKYVREGPETLQKNGKVFLVYSACSADSPDYRLGMTISDASADPLDPKNWRQEPEPIFQRSDTNQVYGPGHNFFFKSPNGKEDWNAYHAKGGTKIDYGDRSTRAQKVDWKDGKPVLGIPQAVSSEIRVPAGDK